MTMAYVPVDLFVCTLLQAGTPEDSLFESAPAPGVSAALGAFEFSDASPTGGPLPGESAANARPSRPV